MTRPRANVILYVGDPRLRGIEKLIPFLKRHALCLASIYDNRVVTLDKPREIPRTFSTILSCDFSDPGDLIKTLKPLAPSIKAVVCRGGFNIASFQKLIPFLPYVKTPTVESLESAMNKVKTRENVQRYDKRISPNFMLVTDAKKKTIAEIKKKVGLPAMVKPAGLAESFLIQIASDEKDLRRSLRNIFGRLREVYRRTQGHGEPEVLVEEYLEGRVYSIECFINSRGAVFCCPLVREVTGREAGYNDFFVYQHLAPVKLSKRQTEEAESVARTAIHALRLRSITAHVELIHTKRGWKLVEVNPRIGGFREDIYRDVYGISLSENDILVRMDRTPRIKKSIKGYSVVLKIYARQEGMITAIRGTRIIRKLGAFQKLWIRKKVGERSAFARNGGENVLTVWLHHKNESVMLMDAQRVERLIQIVVSA
jgi:biotin carboxylase